MKVANAKKPKKSQLSSPPRADFVVPENTLRSAARLSAKASAKLPAELKKILEKSRGAGVVLFEEPDAGDYGQPLATQVAVSGTVEHNFKIRPADNPLDVYRSPHVLDLLNQPLAAETLVNCRQEVTYDDLPGGAFLNRWQLFDFWDLQQSEIYHFCRSACRRIKAWFEPKPKQPVQPLSDASVSAASPVWQQILPVRVLLFFANFYYKIYLIGARLCRLAYLSLGKKLQREEVRWLPKMSEEARTKLDNLAAAGAGPTIKEIIQAKGERQVVMDGKFQLIPGDPSRKKQIQEKYLSETFLRKGVVPPVPQQSAAWPRESVRHDLGNFIFSPASLKPVAVFCGVLVALIVSVKILSYFDIVSQLKGQVMGEAEQALTNINSAQTELKTLDFGAAQSAIIKAQENFASAQSQLQSVQSLATLAAEVVPADNAYKSGVNLVALGAHLAATANHLLSAVTAENNADLSLASRVNNMSIELSSALEELVAAKANADKIGSGLLSTEQQKKFDQLKAALPAAVAALTQARDLADFGVKFLGDKDLRRYLFVFQNDNELRATGGFMGSFALVDFRNGKIEKITVPAGGTYDVRAGFNEKVAPPEALRLVASRFEFQDANWWADFPTSAKNIKWFYEKSGGPTVDGVIAVNSEVFGSLLSVTGPINLPAYGKTITADNFETELQKSIEIEAADKTKPKKIISELAPIMMEKLLAAEPTTFLSLAEKLNTAAKRRDIQVYSADSALQDFIVKNGWSGEISDFSGDFLSVNASNIGGGKTDNAIRQSIAYRVEIGADGSALAKLVIERHHFGPIDDVFTTIANNAYLRVYTPLGSRLVSAVGFKNFSADKFKLLENDLTVLDDLKNERAAIVDQTSGTKIYTENDKTVFANWSAVGPGETETMLLIYQLPFKVAASEKNLVTRAADLFNPALMTYALKFQKQSGRSADAFAAQVVYPNSYQLKFSYPADLNLSLGEINYTTTTEVDRGLVAGFAK